MPSPIEMMIDAACGITEADRIEWRKASITMRCPTCQTTRRAKRHAADPPGTETVVFPCDKCRKGEGPKVIYLDEGGKPLPSP